MHFNFFFVQCNDLLLYKEQRKLFEKMLLKKPRLKFNPGLALIDYRTTEPWGPFLESPVNFSGPKSNIQIEIKRIRARVLASKLLHFVSLTDVFILLDAKLLKSLSCM